MSCEVLFGKEIHIHRLRFGWIPSGEVRYCLVRFGKEIHIHKLSQGLMRFFRVGYCVVW